MIECGLTTAGPAHDDPNPVNGEVVAVWHCVCAQPFGVGG
jgi:hypothetical protein